ncbi:MAG TPA: hypothetical protein GX011_01680 [Clostridiales bacterium]|jgi:FtsH-binding integral membrane protein|nr:hypothetical protein [Clostridiales bacterium]
MTDYTGKIKVYIYSSLFLTLICTLLYGAAYLLSFEPDIGYFKSTALLPVISGALTVASLGFIFSAFVTIPKGAIPASRVPYGHASRLAASGCALGFLGYTAFRLLILGGEPAVSPRLTLFCLILGALSPLYFLPVALGTKKTPGGRVLAGFIPIFWAVITMSEAYTNKYVAMNSPIKVSFMMATLVVMLFMLYELRYLLERGFPRAFLVFTLAGILVLSVFALPTLTLAAARIYVLKTFAAAGVVCLLLGLYMSARLYDFFVFVRLHTTSQKASEAENPDENLSEET